LINLGNKHIVNNVDNHNRNGEIKLGFKLNVEDKINNDLTDIVQAKWEKVMNETGGSKLSMPIEMFSILRVYFQLAYQEGYADMLGQMKEVYENDPDLFEHMFEDEMEGLTEAVEDGEVLN
jgi:hypothetical protein